MVSDKYKKELEEKTVSHRNKEILQKLKDMQEQRIRLRELHDRDYLRYGYEIALIDEIIEKIF